MPLEAVASLELPQPPEDTSLERALEYPRFRLMGSKHKLLPWIYSVVEEIPFSTVLDAFSGSGCVSYLFKAMGKRVTSNDFLTFPGVLAQGLVANPGKTVSPKQVQRLVRYDPRHRHFIERTFSGIFFTAEDLRFLDRVWWNLRRLGDSHLRSLVLSALIRSCWKRQPRGVFTVAGDPDRYKDGRRDLQLSIEEHFHEQLARLQRVPFDSGWPCSIQTGNARDVVGTFDLVYLDPPYVPRSDDNCYMKRYHFLEGLSCYWEGKELMLSSKVRKIEKPYTPFSYRREARQAFSGLFRRFQRSILVLSYSSNGYPDLAELVELMREVKGDVKVYKKDHRYHFGTHSRVKRSKVEEYLVVGY